MIFFIFFYEEKDSMKKFAGAYFMEAYKDELIGLGNGNQELWWHHHISSTYFCIYNDCQIFHFDKYK